MGVAMMKNEILIDITEMVVNPSRTGIQRVTFELIRNLADSYRIIPVRVNHMAELVMLDVTVLDLIGLYFRDYSENHSTYYDEIISCGTKCPSKVKIGAISEFKALLNPEVFVWAPRIQFYENMLERGMTNFFFVLYDMLPATHPQLFSKSFLIGFFPYIRLIRHVTNLCFISEATRKCAVERIFRGRRSVGPALLLGADGVGINKSQFSPNKNNFVVVGTVEPRKNHLKILEGFQRLWSRGYDVGLTFLGRRGWLTETEFEKIKLVQKLEPRFKWIADLPDAQIAKEIVDSRCTIYVSELEGYGLPPIESLALGVPVIASEEIPSLRMIPPFGQLRLRHVSAPVIEEAVLKMLDNDFTLRKYDEIKNLSLPTWSDMCKNLTTWIDNCSQK